MKRAFTMLELLLAVTLLAILTTITFFTFNAIVKIWMKSSEIAEKYQQGDFAIEQITAALRSAYYPSTGKQSYDYGFCLYDDGDDEDAKDGIQWVKTGSAIIGSKTAYAEGPHTIRLRVSDGREQGETEGDLMYVVRDELEQFEEGNDTPEFGATDDEYYQWKAITGGIRGFNVRVADKDKPYNEDGSWNWQEEWPSSNCIPLAVEMTFRMEPTEKEKDPETIVRVIEIPLAYISQHPITSTSDDKKNNERKNREGGVGGGAAGGGGGGGGAQ